MTISPEAGASIRPALSFDMDAGVGGRAAIGLIVLSSDQTIEHEFRQLLGIDGVALFQSRIRNDSRVTPETLKAMEARLFEATDVILPGMPLDVVAFACTSASMVIGEERVFQEIRKARPEVRPTTPITAAFAALDALDALDAGRIALLTPYRADVNEKIRAYIEARGVEVVAMGSFEEEDDLRVCRISEASVKAAAIELGRNPAAEAVFVSCTSLRLAGVIEEIEAELGKPVTSSNHALAWHCLRLAGVADRRDGKGRLFRLDLPPGY
ncbi:MAG: maleate cis-trans isomerase family protein [Geminicoccaceae bacterium]